MITNWLNNRFGTNFNEKELASVKDFSLIWNVFEKEVCNNNCSVQRLKEKIDSVKIDINDFVIFLKYFKNRYSADGIINERFEYLHFRPNDKRELVESVILGVNTDPQDIVLALSIIVYRFRNNMFHGLKNMQEIDKQNENFENANGILVTLLKYF